MKLQLALHLLFLPILQLCHLPPPLPPGVRNPSFLFTRCQPLYRGCYTVLLYFSRYCTIRFKNVCFIFCCILLFTYYLCRNFYTHSLSWVRLFMTPWTVTCQAPLSMEFSKQRYWSGLPFLFPGDRPCPGIKPASLISPALAGGFFTTSSAWKAPLQYSTILLYYCTVLNSQMCSLGPRLSLLVYKQTGLTNMLSKWNWFIHTGITVIRCDNLGKGPDIN